MSDAISDAQIARLFCEPQIFADHAAFTARVERRLDRRWRTRRLLIGAAGTAGGVIAATQVVEANLVQRASALTVTADAHAHDLATTWLTRASTLAHVAAPGLDGEVLWMLAGLVAVGVALLAGRLMEAF